MRRVAIYARVSTEHEAQLSALENQVQYYDNIMKQHPYWELFETYIDEGITGTSVKKRKNFLRMLEDAEKGLFDLIITREVSRFARNTVDTLQETRKLKRIGVEVWFTEDNIWTMNDEDGELRLTIMATLAQNESKKTSLRVKAGQKVSFQNAVPYGNGNVLGYDKLPNHGGYVINPEQAETVRMIYDMYLSGMGERAITYELEKRGRLTSTGKTQWFCSYIGRVLNNAFYCGTIVYRKQFVPDYLEQKRQNNYGEVEQIVVEGKHEPIVTKEEFAEVQKKLSERRAKNQVNDRLSGKKVSDNVWVRKMVCKCGTTFNRKITHKRSDGVAQYALQCYSVVRSGTIRTRIKKGLSIEGICDVPMVQEWKMEMMASKVFSLLFQNKKAVLEFANDLLDKNILLEMESQGISQKKEYEAKIVRTQNKIENLLDLTISGAITKEEYIVKRDSLEKEKAKYQELLDSLEDTSTISEEQLEAKCDLLKIALEHNFDFDRFKVPEELIEKLVDKIVVYNDKFEWYLNFLDGNKIDCLASGTRAHSSVKIAENSIDDGLKNSPVDMQDRLL